MRFNRFTSLGGQDRNKPLPYDGNAPVRTAVRQSFHTSLRNLHQGPRWIWDEGEAKGDGARARPWIDSYLLHSPLDTLEATVEAWEAMEDLVVEGKVRQIGFSSELLSLGDPVELQPLIYLDIRCL